MFISQSRFRELQNRFQEALPEWTWAQTGTPGTTAKADEPTSPSAENLAMDMPIDCLPCTWIPS
jgi:hypothetical protein